MLVQRWSPQEGEEAETERKLTKEVAPHMSPLPRGKEEIHITEPSPVPGTELTTLIIPFNPYNNPVRKLHFAEGRQW